MFAIIKAGGKQIYVQENDTIFIEKVEAKKDDEIIFDQVLAINGEYGKPLVESAKVIGIVEKQGKAKKIIVYRHNAKSTHKRKLGHRQPYTRVKIQKISLGKET